VGKAQATYFARPRRGGVLLKKQDQKRDEPNRRVHGNALEVLYFEIRDLGPRLLGPGAQCSVEMLRAA